MDGHSEFSYMLGGRVKLKPIVRTNLSRTNKKRSQSTILRIQEIRAIC